MKKPHSSYSALPRIEMRDLRMVVAITEFGGITRAAPHINATQSGLSHQLKELESRLGLTLFERVGRRMVPTAVGERLALSGREILGAIRRAEDDITGSNTAPRHRIRLATECYTCYHWLPSLIQRYSLQSSGIDVEIVAEATFEGVSAVLGGTAHVCISFETIHDRRLRAERLFKDEVVVCVAPDHPFASRERIQPEDLLDQRIYIYSPLELSSIYRNVLRPAGVPPAQISRIALTEATVELVKAGLGIAFLARWAVEPHIRARTIRAIRYGPGGLHRTWSAVTRAEDSTPPHVREFVSFLRAAIRPPRGESPSLQALCGVR